MRKLKSAADVLAFAIEREERAARFYRRLAKQVREADTASMLEEFAQEEDAHRLLLKGVVDGDLALMPSAREILDLELSETLKPVTPTVDMTFAETLIIAMKREESSWRFYELLAGRISDPRLKEMFLALAQEERKHKRLFEALYKDAAGTA